MIRIYFTKEDIWEYSTLWKRKKGKCGKRVFHVLKITMQTCFIFTSSPKKLLLWYRNLSSKNHNVYGMSIKSVGTLKFLAHGLQSARPDLCRWKCPYFSLSIICLPWESNLTCLLSRGHLYTNERFISQPPLIAPTTLNRGTLSQVVGVFSECHRSSLFNQFRRPGVTFRSNRRWTLIWVIITSRARKSVMSLAKVCRRGGSYESRVTGPRAFTYTPALMGPRTSHNLDTNFNLTGI